MSFTDTEAAKIRTYMGCTSTFRFEDTRLESAIVLVGQQAEYVTLIQGWLSQLADIETRLTSALSTSGMKRAEDAEWYDQQARIAGLRKEGRRLCARLSTTFGVPLRADAFGEVGYGGDAWMAGNMSFMPFC